MCAVGLDAASIDLVERLCDLGVLPNFATLRDRSARWRLRSGASHRHGTLWSEFVAATELPLDRTGFRCTFDPTTYAAYEEPARHELTGHLPFWEAAGVPTITFDVPRTTIEGPGVHVTGWGAHAAELPASVDSRAGCSARSTGGSGRIRPRRTSTTVVGTTPSDSSS